MALYPKTLEALDEVGATLTPADRERFRFSAISRSIARVVVLAPVAVGPMLVATAYELVTQAPGLLAVALAGILPGAVANALLLGRSDAAMARRVRELAAERQRLALDAARGHSVSGGETSAAAPAMPTPR